MAASYFPRSDSALLVWLNNLQTALPVQAKAVGVNPVELKGALGSAKALASSIQDDEQKRSDWLASVARSAELKRQVLAEIQRTINRLRATAGFTDEHAQALRAVPPKLLVGQIADLQPNLRGKFTGGKACLRWARGPLDGINIYSRRLGEATWQLLGRGTRAPFYDTRPLPGPVSAEIREYRAIGVLHDEEVGQPSDVITVVVCA